MKKWIAVILTVALMMTLLAGCGKSQAVKDAEAAIAAIGNVTLESKAAIEAAQKTFDALSQEEKAEVENYFVLAESKDALQELEAQEAQRAREDAAREAYANIKAAWEAADLIAGDLYNVWHGCVWEKTDMVKKGIQFFVDETNLTEQEVIEGLASRFYVNLYFAKTGIYWNEISESDKQAYRKSAVEQIEKACRANQYMAMDDALSSIVNAYKLNGKLYGAGEALEAAKELLKELPEDYANLSELKTFFTTANALVEFCGSPNGSLTQFSTLLNDYRKEARDYMSVLDFAFD